MGRPYHGLDYYKMSVKLSDKNLSTLSKRIREKGKNTNLSKEVRDLCEGAWLRDQLSDAIENKLLDLEDVAKLFDETPNGEVYARAVREAACMIKVLRDY